MAKPSIVPFLGGVGTHIPGALATDNTYFDALQRNGDYRIDEVDNQLREYRDQEPAMFRWLREMRSGLPAVQQPIWYWYESDLPEIFTFATATAAADATSVSVADPAVFQPGSLVLVQETGEILRLSRTASTAIPATGTSGIADGTVGVDSAAVGRGQLGTAAAIITAGYTLVAMGAPLAERGTATEGNNQLPGRRDNMMSFWATATSVTEMQDRTNMMFDLDFPSAVAKEWFKLQRQVSFNLMFGRRYYIDDTSYGRYYFGAGIKQQIQTNHLDLSSMGGALSWPVFDKWIDNLGENSNGSPGRTCFCGQNLFSALSYMSYQQTVPVTYSTVLGTQVGQLRTLQGHTLDFVLDRHTFFGSNAGSGVVLDANHIYKRTFDGFDFQVKEHIENNNEHIRRDEIYGSAGIEVHNEDCHGFIEGVVALI